MATGSSDDYYGLLGISAQVDGVALRRAWRRLALRWHPDRAGPGATATFQKLLAAYTVLSDPVARAAYDLKRGAVSRSPEVRSSEATSAPSAAARAPRATASAPPVAPSPPRAASRPAPAVMLHRLSGPLNALFACGVARRAEGDIIELFLNTQEVAEGGMLTISMRVPVRCPACAANTSQSCSRCGASRTVEDLFSAWLAIRPEVADGTILTPSTLLDGMIRPVSFRVRHRGAS